MKYQAQARWCEACPRMIRLGVSEIVGANSFAKAVFRSDGDVSDTGLFANEFAPTEFVPTICPPQKPRPQNFLIQIVVG
jgi:hypothetical protein